MTTAAEFTAPAAESLPEGVVPFDPTGTQSLFVDTNVLVFATSPGSPMHGRAVTALRQLGAAGAEVWISRQIVREYLVQMTRPGRDRLDPPAAVAQVNAFMWNLRVADETTSVTAELFGLLQNPGARGKNVHDANIVATMLAHGVGRLLTHNVADFKRYVPLVAVEAL